MRGHFRKGHETSSLLKSHAAGSASSLVESELSPPPPSFASQRAEANAGTREDLERLGGGFTSAAVGMSIGGFTTGLAGAVFTVPPLAFAGVAMVVGSIITGINLNRFSQVVQNVQRNRRSKRIRRELEPLVEQHYDSVRATALTGREEPWESPTRRGVLGESEWEAKGGVTMRRRINKDGTGYFQFSDKRVDSDQFVFCYPGADLSEWPRGQPLRAQGLDLRGANFTGHVEHFDFSGADLRGAHFISMTNQSAQMILMKGTFKGANLRGASLRNVAVVGDDVRFDDADVTDADFTGALLGRDLGGARLTSQQFDSLGERARYAPPAVSVEDVKRESGITDEDELRIMLWSGELEVRALRDNEIVVGEYDPNEHYIPEWALRELVAKNAMGSAA